MYLRVNEEKGNPSNCSKDLSWGYGFMRRKDGR